MKGSNIAYVNAVVLWKLNSRRVIIFPIFAGSLKRSKLLPYPIFKKKTIDMKGLYTILLLLSSNIFMTFAWYGNLKLQSYPWFSKLSLPIIILLSWLVAGLEYMFMIPANRIGFSENGGPFSLWQLKVIQEAISLTIFTIFTVVLFRTQTLKINHLIGFFFLLLAVYFLFKK